MNSLTRKELARTRGAVVVEFGAEWCGICRAFAPTRDRLLWRHPDVQWIPVEDGPGKPLGRSFEVKLWPTFVFLKDGEVVSKLVRPSAAEAEEAFAELSASVAAV